jgi:hypothetical protein
VCHQRQPVHLCADFIEAGPLENADDPVSADGCERFPDEALLAQVGEDRFSSSRCGPISSGRVTCPVAKKYMVVVLCLVLRG